MHKNESTADRVIRVAIGILLLAAGQNWLTGAASIASYALGAILLITGITGFCALYKLFGIDTQKNQ